MRRLAVGALVVIGAWPLLLLPTSAQSPAARVRGIETQSIGGRDAVAGEALVRFRGNPRPPALDDVRADAGADDLERIGRTGVYRIRSRALDAASLVARLARRGDVEYAEPNYVVTTFAAPNDPGFSLLWGLENLGQTIGGVPGTPGADIRASAAWDRSVGSASSVVAVIDTGIDYTHDDLAANMWSAPAAFTVLVGGGSIHCAAGTHGFNAILRTCNPMDDHNHGTHVAGTIGAVGDNQVGVVGVNWTTRLMGIKFLNAQGGGSIADAISGIQFAIEAKDAFAGSNGANVRVLSNSWGGAGFSQALLDEINAANAADMLFVAAAGNSRLDNDIFPTYPASFNAPNVIAVAATTNGDDLAWFSNYGASSVHVGAPGENILSTTIGDTYAAFSGTSMAAPHVSGAAALVLSVCAIDTAALKDALIGAIDSVPALSGATITGGRINVNSAMYSCTAPPSTPTDLTAHGGDRRVTLAWTPSLGATRNIVKRSLTAGGPYTVIAADAKGSAYTDTAVVNGTRYHYVVAAANSLGESGDSNEASAVPQAPSDLVISTFTTPSTAGAGISIAVSVTTQNQGAGPAEATTTAVYLSDNSQFDPTTDRRLSAEAIGPLTPGASTTRSVTIGIPADATAGSYYLIAVADADGAEDEAFESNNRFLRSLRVGPDLTLTALTVPLNGAAGGIISIASTVENQGGGDAAASAVTFFLSSNSTLDAGDVSLSGSRPVPLLAAGATSAGSAAVTIPADTGVGTYYVIGKADGRDEVVEPFETNNTSARSIKIGGDLVITTLTAPSTAGAGAVIVVADTTANQGMGGVAASVTRFYLSTNWSLDANDVRLAGSRAVPELGPSASSSGSTSLTIPATTAAGAYYLLAAADADMAVIETQESNNTASRGLKIGADLVVSSLTIPARGAAGSTLLVTDTTSNQGDGTAAVSATKFYLSPNSLLDATDTLLSPDHAVPALAPGAAHTASTALMIPAVTPSGSYYVIAKADGGGIVVETQETNNVIARSLQIGGDLVVSAFTAPARSGAGGSIVVSDTTINQGAGRVAASTTRFYLSLDWMFDTSDVLLVGARPVPELDSGVTSSGSTTVSIPATAATGAYYLIAKADGDGTVLETSESNNASSRGFQIGPDLYLQALSVPSKGGAGSAIVVTDTTANQGGGLAAESVVTFYFSTDWILDASDIPLTPSRAVPALPSGGTSPAATTVTIPATAAAGVHYLIAKADATQGVPETQEGNNTRYGSIRIGPDLWVSSLWPSPTKMAPGGSVNVTDTIVNQGGGAAGSSTTTYYLSTNYTLEAGDVALGTRVVPALAAGASNTAVTALAIPAGSATGSFYLLAHADSTTQVSESPETNNVTAVGFQVTMTP